MHGRPVLLLVLSLGRQGGRIFSGYSWHASISLAETRSHLARRALESLASADRRDLEMEWCMAWMAAFIHHRFRRFVTHANRNELVDGGMRFTKVRAESALTIFDVLHAHLGLFVTAGRSKTVADIRADAGIQALPAGVDQSLTRPATRRAGPHLRPDEPGSTRRATRRPRPRASPPTQ